MALDPKPAKLGTFYGVFTPSILTILGVVLFLRTGWVVGNVGLLATLAIVVLAHLITLSTGLSVSAIATNMKVGAGGAYYMISRSLGLEIGGAIGIPLFLAQTFSVTLYAFGLAESLRLFWPDLPMRPVAAATVIAVTLLANRSTELALKLQFPIMVAIGLALTSLVVGVARQGQSQIPLWAGTAEGAGFWTVFAVFFPAVTGLMAGISLSGDLKDPKRSITVGTLAAIGVGFVVYLVVPIVLVAGADADVLVSDHLVWFKVAAVPWLVFPGLFGAIFSSAVGSILGAPRTLEALEHDRVIPALPRRLFGRELGDSVALMLSAAVALAAVGLGNLNAVAPVLTMFFLTTYAVVNLVAGIEQLSGDPSYRPTLRVHWLVSLAGALGCLWVMALINPLAAIAAVVVEISVYALLRRRSLSASFGDLRYGASMSLIRAALLRMKRLPVDARNWRPNILVFAGDPNKRLELLQFASWLNQKRGILTVSRLLVGDLEELAPQIEEETQRTAKVLDEQGIVAFAETEIVATFEEGVLNVCQANGIGGLSSNTVMIGWSSKPERVIARLRIARHAALLGKSTILCRIASRRWSGQLRRIDVWWGGLANNGDMLLLFAHLVSLNHEWSGARIAVKSIASNAMTLEQTERNLSELIERIRIDADAVVLPRPEGATIHEVIHRESQGADVVFMGLQEVAENDEAAYAERLARLIGDLPTVILVHAAGPFAGRLL